VSIPNDQTEIIASYAPALHLAKFVTEALAIDVEEAKKNGTLGYISFPCPRNASAQ
jgi:hypothetical protein